jgi:hypothetical protein
MVSPRRIRQEKANVPVTWAIRPRRSRKRWAKCHPDEHFVAFCGVESSSVWKAQYRSCIRGFYAGIGVPMLGEAVASVRLHCVQWQQADLRHASVSGYHHTLRSTRVGPGDGPMEHSGGARQVSEKSLECEALQKFPRHSTCAHCMRPLCYFQQLPRDASMGQVVVFSAEAEANNLFLPCASQLWSRCVQFSDHVACGQNVWQSLLSL